MGVPIALHSEYLPPTQSQKPNMLFVSMPKDDTASAFVESAAKCFATHVGSFECLDRSHDLAVWAFVMVSCVVNLLFIARKGGGGGGGEARGAISSQPEWRRGGGRGGEEEERRRGKDGMR